MNPHSSSAREVSPGTSQRPAVRWRFGGRGFTLLEIMLVVMIIALLLTAAVKYMAPALGFAKDTVVEGHLNSLRIALTQYEGITGALPTTEQGLRALVVEPQSEPRPARWRQCMEDLPKDPWQQDYVYVCPGKHNPTSYDLYSKGPDRTAETADDIGNWKK
ncbi:MAG: type II secretion system major pseudopilin GspG [Verrucomicrobia bacterium]|nr:type II secretion system major pseudopilin GspG [Verrucomicrobiota bacterium]